jgi:hypothetical protein
MEKVNIMMYPPTKRDQFLHNLPGGAWVAHMLGKLENAFQNASLPADAAALKAKMLADFKPVTDRLAAIPQDSAGRRWRVYTDMSDDVLTPEQKNLEMTFGFFNDAEERAFLYFKRNGGSAIYPGNGLSWSQVDALSYAVGVPVGEAGDPGFGMLPVPKGEPGAYYGMLPVPKGEEGLLRRQFSTKPDQYIAYFLDRAMPGISSRADRFNVPKTAAQPAQP